MTGNSLSVAAQPRVAESPHLIHGTYDGYANHVCRCGRCTRAHTIYFTQYMEARAVQLGPCEIAGCERGQYAKGLCQPHYERQRTGSTFEGPIRESTVLDRELRCVSCQEWLPDACFPHSSAMPHRRGRHAQCIDCGLKARREYRKRGRVPCEDCGTFVEGKGRANTRTGKHGGRVQLDPNRPYLCKPCASSRMRKAAA